jgi:tRNA A37 threonylcarbamoyltransferase TsaD
VALTLGIETSCDETSVALVEDGRRVVSNVIHSQVDVHKEFGGVVPELAARDHLERLPALIDLAFEKAGAKPADVDLLAVTRGPGLVGCLLVGVGVGEGLSAAWGKPLTGVNHLWGHIYAAMLSRPDLEPPLLGLVVSGAHSDLVRMPAHSVTEQDRADLAAAFERSVVESLLEKLDKALGAEPYREVVVAGGVAANTLLRQRAAEVVEGRARLTMPPPELCTDNAAMIAAAGFYGARHDSEVDPSLGWS